MLEFEAHHAVACSMNELRTTQTGQAHPAIHVNGAHGRAIDLAIELLGAALRSESANAHERRAEILRGRLAGAGQSALRARVEAASVPNFQAVPAVPAGD